jgi:HNH endonuclease
MIFTITNRKGEVFPIKIDEQDAERVLTFEWYISKSKKRLSVRRGDGKKHIWLSRFIMGNPPSNVEVDHINGNTLDNRRLNLRLATRSQNCANKGPSKHTSSFKGVSWKQRNGKWCSQIKYRGKVIHIGLYDTEEAAAKAYDVEALIRFGEYARLNFPEEARH